MSENNIDILHIAAREYPNIPSLTIWALDLYLNNRIPTGGFLRHVLSNKLFEAIGAGDFENIRCIRDITTLIFNNFPMESWGSAEKMDEWVSKRRTI